MSLVRINLNPSRGQLRIFGILTSIFLGTLGVVVWHRGWHVSAAIILLAGGLVVTSGLIFARFMRLLYLAAAFASFPIGAVTSYMVLGAIYFLVLTPVGLILRISGKDPLERRYEAARPTYWKPRGSKKDARSYLHQY